MKTLRTALILISTMMFLLSGCSFLVPEEYKDGVKVNRDYPDDDLPLYDDAIVFSCEEDDGEINLLMGTEDDIDDVMDFYTDFFKDEDVLLYDEDEGRNDYYAEGHVPGYDFELQAGEPDGKWEEKLFSCVIEITVTPAEDPVASNQLVGSWAMEGIFNGTEDISSDYWEYLICTFYDDGTGIEIYKWPYEQEYTALFSWSADGDVITFKLEDGSVISTTIETLDESSFVEKYADSDDYDTIKYTRVANDAWRPENITPVNGDASASNSSYGEYANIEEIYGPWVDYYSETAFAFWPDGTGRQWDYTYDTGWDITWAYDQGLLYIYYGDNFDYYDYYNISYDGTNLYIQSNELGIAQYMQRPEYNMVYIPWVLIYDGNNTDYIYDTSVYLYFYDNYTYDVVDYSSISESGTWKIDEYGTLVFNEDITDSYYMSFEGNQLVLYNGINYYVYRTQYALE